jgi:hypothetical protein
MVLGCWIVVACRSYGCYLFFTPRGSLAGDGVGSNPVLDHLYALVLRSNIST